MSDTMSRSSIDQDYCDSSSKSSNQNQQDQKVDEDCIVQNFQNNYPGFKNLDHYDQKEIHHNVITLEYIDKIISLFNQKQQQQKRDKRQMRRQKQKKVVPFMSTVNLQKLQKMKSLFEDYLEKKIKMNFNQMSKQLKLGQRTIYRYWKQYKKDPSLKSKQLQIIHNRNTYRIWKGQQEVTILRTQAILQLMKLHRKWTIDELAKRLNKNPKLIKQQRGKILQVQNHNICNILKRQGFKRIRVRKQLNHIKHSAYFIQRRRFCQNFMSNHNRAIPAYYFFIKEIDLYFKRLYGWYKKDQDIQDQGQLKINRKGLFLTSFGGFQYPILWKVQLQTITSQSYILKLLNYINNLDDMKVNTPKMLICQRNSPLYREDILQILKKLNFKLLFLPQKDYNLNPLHLWFKTLKLALFKVDFTNLLEIKSQIQGLDTEYIDNISQYLKKCLNYIEKTMENEISININ